jgi:hypothetical protein
VPLSNAYHGSGAPEPRDLRSRIDAELRGRIEDAVDYACLEAMVRARRERGGPAPKADAPRDREEFQDGVRAFLEVLRATMASALAAEQRDRLSGAIAPPHVDVDAALTAQVEFAKALPDYWQRFEDARARWNSSGRERRGFLDRFLGRG